MPIGVKSSINLPSKYHPQIKLQLLEFHRTVMEAFPERSFVRPLREIQGGFWRSEGGKASQPTPY